MHTPEKDSSCCSSSAAFCAAFNFSAWRERSTQSEALPPETCLSCAPNEAPSSWEQLKAKNTPLIPWYSKIVASFA